jgi:hypothetical protein
MKLFRILLVSVSLLALSCYASVANAAILYESGTLGPTGVPFSGLGGGTAPGSSGVTPNLFSGVRFQLLQPAKTTRVGGHFVHNPSSGNTFFGAIVRLDNGDDFPDSGNLSTSDVKGTSLLTFSVLSAEVFGDLELHLDPGWYALVFGSGLFGADGSGAAVLNNPDIGSPSYIAHQTGAGWIELSTLPGPFRNFHLVVEGTIVPEPTGVTMVILAVFALLGMFESRRIVAPRNLIWSRSTNSKRSR